MPSLEQVRHVIETMPAEDSIQRRDRALVAFILLTGARDGAVASLKVGDDVRLIVEGWADYLGRELLWGPNDPLFPATRMEAGPDRLFHAVGLEQRHWSSAGPIRKVFRSAFAAAGLPYFRPIG